MDWVSRIAEDRIREAIERGELRNLPGEGKPLEIEDLSHVPEDLRAAYIMLRNAGVVPEEVQLAKETVTLEDLLRMCRSEEERRHPQEAEREAAPAPPADGTARLVRSVGMGRLRRSDREAARR